MFDFDRPAFLFLIPAAILLQWFAGRRSLARWPPRQAILCNLLRALILVLLCLALAGPRWLTKTSEAAVVLLRDVSASIEAQAGSPHFAEALAATNSERVAEVVFAREPLVVKAFGARRSQEPLPAPGEEATDLSAALEFAATLMPADRPSRIVLLSDGVATTGRNPLETAAQLQNVEIDTVPLRSVSGPDAAVVSIKPPGAVREGEIFDLSAQLYSAAPAGSVAVRLYQNNLLVSEVQRDLPQGISEITFPNLRAEGRMGLYEVAVTAPDDSTAGNNRKRIAVVHAGRPKVLIIDKNPAQAEPMAEALRTSDFDVEIRPPGGLPARHRRIRSGRFGGFLRGARGGLFR